MTLVVDSGVVAAALVDSRPDGTWANQLLANGWYVALAESLDARLAILDLRLSRAAGPRCGFATPPVE